MIGLLLDMIGSVALPASVWAMSPSVAAAAGGAVLVVVLGIVGFLVALRRRARAAELRPASAGSADVKRAVGTRLLILKLEGDADGAVGRTIAEVLSRRLDRGTTLLDSAGAGVKFGRGPDDEARRGRILAAKARAHIVLWGGVEAGVARLRIVADGGACEAYSLPTPLAAPFDAALAALVAASAGQASALTTAASEIAETLKKPPSDASDAARLRACLARAALVLHAHDRERSRLDATLAVTASQDPRRETEPLEWAEVQTLRADALGRALAGLIEPPRQELRDRVDAWRAAMAVWTEQGASDRAARGEASLAQALLDLAEVESDVRGLAEASQLAESALARAGGPEAAGLTALVGAAHLRLGEREPRVARLEAAERELRRALVLAEAGGDRVRAAAVKDDLARALARLGERDRGAERLRAAAVIYRLSVEDSHRSELSRARMRAALGRTLVHVGERERDAGAVDEAVGALRMASNSFVTCGAAAEAAQARRALERAERLYGELRAASRAIAGAES